MLSFIRTKGPERIFCAFNLSDKPARVTMPAGTWQPLGAELGAAAPSQDRTLQLGPWQACFACDTGASPSSKEGT